MIIYNSTAELTPAHLSSHSEQESIEPTDNASTLTNVHDLTLHESRTSATSKKRRSPPEAEPQSPPSKRQKQADEQTNSEHAIEPAYSTSSCFPPNVLVSYGVTFGLNRALSDDSLPQVCKNILLDFSWWLAPGDNADWCIYLEIFFLL